MNGKIFRKGTIVGFALFSTFFGAGNLIFPPGIGIASGTQWLSGAIGLFVSGILLPVIAVIAVNNSGGNIKNVLNPVSSWFYNLFYIAMIMGLAMTSTMPKLAATTHEMGIKALTSAVPMPVTVGIFFVVVFLLAKNSNDVVNKLGKYLTPALLIALLVIVAAAVIKPLGTPAVTGIERPFIDALMTGYNTGDLTLGLMCASLFFNALRDGELKENEINKGIYVTALVAIAGLTIIYTGLLYLGATGTVYTSPDMSMATVLIVLVEQLLGKAGSGVLAVIVILACLTTGIGIATIAGEFVEELTKGKIKYTAWLIVVCIVGGALGVLGVNRIVGYASFMFMVIYPVCIVITFLGLVKPFLPNDGPFKGGVLMAFIFSFMETLLSTGVEVSIFRTTINMMPLKDYGFAWFVPAVIGAVVGTFIVKTKVPDVVE